MFRILSPIIILGAAIGLFFLKTDPVLVRVAEIEKTRAALASAQASNDQFQQVLKEKNVIFNQIDDNKKIMLKKMIPDSIDNVKLIIDINQIASENGMTIRNISIGGNDASTIGPDSRAYGVASLGFSVSGPYQTFKKFLNALETSLRLVDVTALSFSAGDRDQYEYNMEINAYWLKQQ